MLIICTFGDVKINNILIVTRNILRNRSLSTCTPNDGRVTVLAALLAAGRCDTADRERPKGRQNGWRRPYCARPPLLIQVLDNSYISYSCVLSSNGYYYKAMIDCRLAQEIWWYFVSCFLQAKLSLYRAAVCYFCFFVALAYIRSE